MQDATHMNYIVMPVFQFCRIYREREKKTVAMELTATIGLLVHIRSFIRFLVIVRVT